MANLSFKCSLKFNFLSSFSTTRLSKYKSRCFGECDFLEKITSWACLVRSGLKTIFYCLAHSRIFLKSLFSTFAVSKGSQISENKEVSSANNLTLLFKLCVRSLIYIRKNNGPNIEPCRAPAWIVSQSDVWTLSRTLWNLLLKKLLINWNKFTLTPFFQFK